MVLGTVRYEGADRPAYTFPIYNTAGTELGKRVKFIDAKGGYNWIDWKQPKGSRYYFNMDALAEIKRTGVVYIAEGEQDVLTLWAMGIRNALCWFNGTGNLKKISEHVFSDMKLLGARTIYYIPDFDHPGLRAAVDLFDAYQDSFDTEPTQFLKVLKVPIDVEGDLNDAFIVNDFKLDINEFESWSLRELRKHVDMFKPLKQGNKLIEDGKEVNEKVLDALREHALKIGELQSNGERVKLPAFQDNHKSDKLGEHAWFYMSSCVAYDFVGEGKITRKELTERWKIDVKGLGGWHPKSTPSANGNSHKPARQNGNGSHPMLTPVEDMPEGFGVWGDDELAKREAYLADKTVKPKLTAIRNPVPVLRQYGGLAKFLKPGKVFVWMSPSGGGKTISSEMMAEELMLDGHNVMFWGAEWSPDENADRRIQRYGGASLDDIWEDEIVRQFDYAPPADWDLKALTEHERKNSLKIVRGVRGRTADGSRGDVCHIDSKYSYASMKLTLRWMSILLEKSKRQDKAMPVVIFDYIQLVNQDESSNNQDEASFEQFKQFCMANQVVGIMTSQVTKSGTTRANEGKQISAMDAQYIRSDKSNLFVTAQRLYHEGEPVSVEIPIGDGKTKVINSILMLTIDKNSTGGSKVIIYLSADEMCNLRIDMETPIPPRLVREAKEVIDQKKKEIAEFAF